MSDHTSHQMHENSLLSWDQHDGATREEMVLDVYRKGSRKGGTDRQVLDHLMKIGRLAPTDDMNKVRPTIKNLIDKGELCECGKTIDQETGRTVRLVRMADEQDRQRAQEQAAHQDGVVRMAPRSRDRFTIIHNDVLNDYRLSWRARGILCHLLSKPADWVTRPRDLHRFAKDGRDASIRGFNELIDAGYVVRTRERRDDGTILWHYVVHEQPVPENPAVDQSLETRAWKPEPGNQAPYKGDSTKEPTKERETSSGDAQRLVRDGLVVAAPGSGDIAALNHLISTHRYEAVAEACRQLQTSTGRRPFVSAIEKALSPSHASDQQAEDAIVGMARRIYRVSDVCRRQLLVRVFARYGRDAGRECRRCQKQHGQVTTAWLQDVIDGQTQLEPMPQDLGPSELVDLADSLISEFEEWQRQRAG